MVNKMPAVMNVLTIMWIHILSHFLRPYDQNIDWKMEKVKSNSFRSFHSWDSDNITTAMHDSLDQTDLKAELFKMSGGEDLCQNPTV